MYHCSNKKSELMLMRRARAVPVRSEYWFISIHFVALHSSAAKNRTK